MRSPPNTAPPHAAPEAAGRGRLAVEAAILAAGSLFVFAVPWHVPVRVEIFSDSSAFGFSNGAALVGLAATLLALLAARLAAGRGAEGRPWIHDPAAPTLAERIALAAAVSASAAVIWGWWQFIPASWFGESTYFLTRLDMMTLGRAPYRDFEFGYGPALLHLPYAVHRLSRGAVAIDTAYVLTVILHAALGLAAAAWLLRRLTHDARVRVALVVFVAAATINITLGVIYTPLRFVYAPWAAVAFHEVQARRSSAAAWAAAFLLPLGGLAVSPEAGLATIAAILVGLAFDACHGRAGRLPRAIAVAAAPAALLGWFGTGAFSMLASFGGGALNFPLLPLPYVLALLGVACAVLPRLGAAALRGRGAEAPVIAALATTLGLGLPPALGRCDPGHVLFNGLVLVVVALAAAWSRPARGPRVAATLAAAVIFLTHWISFANHYAGPVLEAITIRAAISRQAAAVAAADRAVRRTIVGRRRDMGWSKGLPFVGDLPSLLRFGQLATPFGATEDIDHFLKTSGQYVPVSLVPPFIGLFDPRGAERIAAGLEAHEHILLPAAFAAEGLPTIDPEEFGREKSRALSSLFVWPVTLRTVNPPWIGEIEVMRRVRGRIEPVAAFRDMIVFRRRRTADQDSGGR